jgi:hypothetical protein
MQTISPAHAGLATWPTGFLARQSPTLREQKDSKRTLSFSRKATDKFYHVPEVHSGKDMGHTPLIQRDSANNHHAEK